jgi:hypothetical protein
LDKGEKKKLARSLSLPHGVPRLTLFFHHTFFLFHLFSFRHGCYGSSLARVSDIG